jgi:hypothetical protein
MNKNKNKWNPEDWQGRSKKQYESSAIGVGVSIAGFMIIYFIIKFINFIFA